MSKIVLVGCGQVGATFAYTVLLKGLTNELVVIDSNKEKALGDVLDLNHGLMLAHPMKIGVGDYPDCADADLIVISAGVAQRPGETRIDLMSRNVAVFDAIISQVTRYNRDGILLIATNPVDILTQVALKLSGWPAHRVIGSGTLLDSSRLRYLMASRLGVDPRSVHGMVIGEHGDSEIAVWSAASVGGVPIDSPEAGARWHLSPEERAEIYEETRTAAYQIIAAKGATYYAIALALARICEAVLRDQKSILPVSTYLQDYHGIDGLCLGVPAVVGRRGVEEVVRIPLTAEEERQLQASAAKLRQFLDEIGF
ncbi:L-lactate dehydrogenase [Symbiobacterium terraclitae]|uniref:L-lactate dehydrogenase n=1 Tax=Symbiobacterium terraclitae TaxID=557451 RepID=UPI0035B534A2